MRQFLAIIGALVLDFNLIELTLDLFNLVMLVKFFNHRLKDSGLTLLSKADSLGIDFDLLAHLEVLELESFLLWLDPL